MEELYRQVILDYHANPRNKGILARPDYSAADWNPLCGDKIKFDFNLDAKGKVKEARFNGEGCAISQAAASMLTEKIQGKSLSQLAKLKENDILAMIGVKMSPARIKCAVLALLVLRKAMGLKPLEISETR